VSFHTQPLNKIHVTLCVVLTLFCFSIFGCGVPRGSFLRFEIPPDVPEKPELTEIRVDQDHQGLNATKGLSYKIGPYDGLVIDLGNLKNERFKGIPADAVEILQVMDGHRIYNIKINQKKRRYVLLPRGGMFLENELAITVGYLALDQQKISTFPTWMGHVVVDQKLIK
jgi:hypothetical protein